MTLIELVRLAREKGYPWIAIDKNGSPLLYDSEPHPVIGPHSPFWGFSGNNCERVPEKYNLTCDWRKAIIEVNKITETGEP